jgi:hypothetical protein
VFFLIRFIYFGIHNHRITTTFECRHPPCRREPSAWRR